MTEFEWNACESPEKLLSHRRNSRSGNNRERRLVGIACCWFAFGEAVVEDRQAHQTLWAMENQIYSLAYQDSHLDGASQVRDKEFVLNQDPAKRYTPLTDRQRAKWNALDAACLLEDAFGIDLPDNLGLFFSSIRCAVANSRHTNEKTYKRSEFMSYPIPEAADIVRDIIQWSGLAKKPGKIQTWMADPTVLMLAESAKRDRSEYGKLDPITILALADSLEEAGCQDTRLLEHLRGSKCPHCQDADFIVGDLGIPIFPETSRANARKCRCGGSRMIQKPHWLGCWAIESILGGYDGR